MTVHSAHRRGVIMIVVVLVMAVVGGMTAVLAACGSQRYQDRQIARLRMVARSITDSGAAYARAHRDTWAGEPPANPILLDVTGLLPPQMDGTATLEVVTVGGRRVCRITSHVELVRFTATNELELPLGPAAGVSATLPASRAAD
jgi:hypothetical protein